MARDEWVREALRFAERGLPSLAVTEKTTVCTAATIHTRQFL